MGLDFVEIMIGIEEAFDVKLSEEDMEDLLSDRDIVVGDLYDHILRKLQLRDVARYDFGLNYALWTELQGVIHRVAEVSLDQVQLKTPLEVLFPRNVRRARWKALCEACPYRVAELDYPKIVRRVGFLLAASMVLFEQFQIWQIPGAKWLWPLLGIFGLWMLVETYTKVLTILSPLRTHFPSGMMTVKDFCRAVLATNYLDICRDVEIPQDERLDQRCLEVWQKLVEILVDALGVDADRVILRARLVKDLGMN